MSQRDEYIEDAKRKLDELNHKLDDLEKRSREAKGAMSTSLERQLERAKASRDSMAKELKSLREASSSSWETFREGVNRAWDSFSTAVQAAKVEFELSRKRQEEEGGSAHDEDELRKRA